MPLFFFLSGFTLREEKLQKPFFGYFRDTATSILPAYAFFCLIGFVFWLLVGRSLDAVEAAKPIWRPLAAILYGSGSSTNQLFPVILWFFPCLFCTLLLYRIIAVLPPLLTLGSVLASLTLGVLLASAALPWELETALLAVPFVWMGNRLRSSSKLTRQLETAPLWIIPAFLLVGVVTAALNTPVDMRKSSVGNTGLFILSATASIAALFTLCLKLPALRFIQRVSTGTVAIFPLHPYVFWAAAFVYTAVWGNAGIKNNYLVALLVSCVAVVTLTLTAPLIIKLFAPAKAIVRGHS